MLYGIGYRALFGCMVIVYALVGGEFKIIALDAEGPVGARAGWVHGEGTAFGRRGDHAVLFWRRRLWRNGRGG